ncbi:MAG: flagellar export chaperone FliS [Christensenellales bacterium]|jgi:flagellar protein FliS
MYAAAQAQNKYVQQGVLTANPVELIVMLYDGCVKQMKKAKIAIGQNKPALAHECLGKAQKIILELVNCLNLEYPIAQDLMELYDFLLQEVIEINLEKDADRIDGVVGILADLRQAWSQITDAAKGYAVLEE